MIFHLLQWKFNFIRHVAIFVLWKIKSLYGCWHHVTWVKQLPAVDQGRTVRTLGDSIFNIW